MDDESVKNCSGNKGQSGGSPVYGLGVIGAWVYFWKRADTPRDRALGLLKGMVWPAYLVYEAFSATSGRTAAAPPDDSYQI
jgi:hypothetical protein